MVTAKSEKARILIGTRFFFVSRLKGLKKMIKATAQNKYNPLDPLFNTFIYDKNNKNAFPYNGIYKRIQAHRQAQKQYRYTCINIVNKPLDGLILAIIEQNKQASYTQVFQQVIHQKSPKSNSSGIKPDREIHTDSYIAILN
jgi:hypothetical protein